MIILKGICQMETDVEKRSHRYRVLLPKALCLLLKFLMWATYI